MKYSELIDSIDEDIKTAKTSTAPRAIFVVKSYEKLKEDLLLFAKNKMNQNVTNLDIDTLNITDKAKEKLKQKISNVNTASNSEIGNSTNELLEKLKTLNGLSDSRAMTLINSGLTQYSDLSKAKYFNQLPLETQLYFKYKPLTQIPHTFIEKIEEKIKTISSETGLKMTICGSYRRQKEFSRDIDILVEGTNLTRSKEKIEPDDPAHVFAIISKSFIDNNIDYHEYMRGDDKMCVIARFNVDDRLNKKYVKIDFMRASKSEMIPMILYFTGSAQFNIVMRAQAKRKGYLLNQRGIYKITKKAGEDQLELIPIKTEKQIFELLDMEYKQPQER